MLGASAKANASILGGGPSQAFVVPRGRVSPGRSSSLRSPRVRRFRLRQTDSRPSDGDRNRRELRVVHQLSQDEQRRRKVGAVRNAENLGW